MSYVQQEKQEGSSKILLGLLMMLDDIEVILKKNDFFLALGAINAI